MCQRKINIMIKKIKKTQVITANTIVLRNFSKRGSVFTILLEQILTQFNIQHKTTKKSRSDVRDKKIKKTLYYQMVGKKINVIKKGWDTSILLRNVQNLACYEIKYHIFSPMISEIFCENRVTKYNRTTAYELRRKSGSFSKVDFDYVIDYAKNIDIN